MFGKLKNFAASSMINGVIEKLTPILNTHLEKITTLSPAEVYDDQIFDSVIAKPAWTDVSASLGGLAQLYPAMDEKFILGMHYVRDEIVTVNEDKVELVPDFANKLSELFTAGLSKIG